MNKFVAIFSIQGSIWLNKKNQQLYLNNDIIEIINLRNDLKDWDKIGKTGGNCPDPGWYSLTLANIKKAKANTAQVGDTLKLSILSEQGSKLIHNLGTYVVTKEDIALGGVVVEFDLNNV